MLRIQYCYALHCFDNLCFSYQYKNINISKDQVIRKKNIYIYKIACILKILIQNLIKVINGLHIA